MQKIPTILGIIGLTLAFQNAQAIPAKPNHCPSVNAIISRGLEVADQTIDGWSVGVISEQYDTDMPFTFVIGAIQALNIYDAKMIANSALKTLTFIDGPTYDELTKVWMCHYKVFNGGLPVAAWTPSHK